MKPEEIGPVDVILLTHRHSDHLDIETLPRFVSLNPKTTVVTHPDVGEILNRAQIPWERLEAGNKTIVQSFTIQALEAPHGSLPVKVPDNLGYLINERFLHPGDSISLPAVPSCLALGLPIAGPWMKLVEAIEFGKRIHPTSILPIHDAIVQPFFLTRIYTMCQTVFEPFDIAFTPLERGRSFEI